MIIGYVGTPGSGKSYEAVKKILENLRLGRKVYTNIDGLDRPECREAMKGYCNITDYQLQILLHHLDNEESQTFWDHVSPGSLIVLDEVHKLFSNRDWASTENKIMCSWASTHRHHGFDVVFVTQDIEKIDKHARSLIEWTYFFRKVNYFGSLVQKKYMCYAYAGDDHNGQPLSKNVRTYNPAVFACYSSYSATDVKELGLGQHVNLLKHPIFYAIPVVLVLAVYLILGKSSFATGDLFGSKAAMAKTRQPVALVAPPVVPAAVVPPPTVATQASPSDGQELTEEKPRNSNPIRRYRMPDGSLLLSNYDSVPPGASIIF